MGLFVLPKKRNASEMEYKHKLQRAREKLRLVREGPQRSPCMVPNEWRFFVHSSASGGF